MLNTLQKFAEEIYCIIPGCETPTIDITLPEQLYIKLQNDIQNVTLGAGPTDNIKLNLINTTFNIKRQPPKAEPGIIEYEGRLYDQALVENGIRNNNGTDQDAVRITLIPAKPGQSTGSQ